MNSNNIVLIALMLLVLSNNTLSPITLYLLLGFLCVTGCCCNFGSNTTTATT